MKHCSLPQKPASYLWDKMILVWLNFLLSTPSYSSRLHNNHFQLLFYNLVFSNILWIYTRCQRLVCIHPSVFLQIVIFPIYIYCPFWYKANIFPINATVNKPSPPHISTRSPTLNSIFSCKTTNHGDHPPKLCPLSPLVRSDTLLLCHRLRWRSWRWFSNHLLLTCRRSI